MNQDKQDKFKADFPQIFIDLQNCTPQESCMAWGVAVGDGWYDLLYKLCEDIMALDPPEDFKATQVKEKFGGLRFYFKPHDVPTRIIEIIDLAEEKSLDVCEECGSYEEVTTARITGFAWIKTLCEECRK